MGISTADVKRLFYGENIGAASPADYFAFLNGIEHDILPEHFSNPLAALTGGLSMVSGGRSSQAVLFSGDWLYLCLELGASVKHAALSLAANYDEHIGIVALSLEIAGMTRKKKADPKIKLSNEDIFGVFATIVGGNYANVRAKLPEWDVKVKFEDPAMLAALAAKKTRSDWRTELGHDVLIHPVTLTPCATTEGEVLKYNGIKFIPLEGSETNAALFEFETTGGALLHNNSFLPKLKPAQSAP